MADDSKIDDAARALAQALCLPPWANRGAIRQALAGAASAGRREGWLACCAWIREQYPSNVAPPMVIDAAESKVPGEAG